MVSESFKERLFNQLDGELCFAREYQNNIDQAMDRMRDAVNWGGVTAHAESVAYNGEMLRIHLERAAAVLELLEAFSPETDSVNMPTIESKVRALKEKLAIPDAERKE